VVDESRGLVTRELVELRAEVDQEVLPVLEQELSLVLLDADPPQRRSAIAAANVSCSVTSSSAVS
jgi:hypothetical protein